MIWGLAFPGAVLGLLMGVDEVVFHRRRELPRWERLGHPLDTLSVVICYALALFLQPDRANLWLYLALAGFSCLLVTKDEPVHTRYCVTGEHWLHAMLFVLHPLALLSAAALWWAPRMGEAGIVLSAGELQFARMVLWTLGGSALAFGFYQWAYWNLKWSK